MRSTFTLIILFLVFLLAGCAPVVVGAGATGAYKVSSDERTVGDMWDDTKITTMVKAELIKDPMIEGRKIDVDTLEGNVTLSGVVRTRGEAQYATKVVSKVSGVKKVKNNLQIGSRTAGQVMDDQILGNKIKAKLIGEPGIRSLNIDVDVYMGVVTLTGIVDSKGQKEKAVNIAKTTSGTVRVVDKIKV
jgi:hyperosmotically inducible protein